MKEDYESLCRICFYWGEPLDIIKTPYILKMEELKMRINKNPYVDYFISLNIKVLALDLTEKHTRGFIFLKFLLNFKIFVLSFSYE